MKDAPAGCVGLRHSAREKVCGVVVCGGWWVGIGRCENVALALICGVVCAFQGAKRRRGVTARAVADGICVVAVAVVEWWCSQVGVREMVVQKSL